MSKTPTVALIGIGNRGMDSYVPMVCGMLICFAAERKSITVKLEDFTNEVIKDKT